MNGIKSAGAIAGALLAAAVMGQSTLAHAGGCLISVVWIDNVGARIARSCADGSAAGAVEREANGSNGTKKYLVTSDLRRDQTPDT
ncbi:MAG: hypothetical protein RL033_3873, partial [Pseudomonadota bacterium]